MVRGLLLKAEDPTHLATVATGRHPTAYNGHLPPSGTPCRGILKQKCPKLEKSLSEHGEDREPGLAFPTACFRKPCELETEPMESLLGHGFLNFYFLWLILLNYLGGTWLALLQSLKIAVGSHQIQDEPEHLGKNCPLLIKT